MAVAGSFPVLTGVDITVQEGEIVLLQGKNVAGNTSVLRACAGLIRINDGSAQVFGFDMRITRQAPRRYIGLLGHENNLYRDLWAIEHVEFRAVAGGGLRGDAAQAIARVGLASRLWSVASSD